jgi:hypothetical protein
MRTEPKRNGGEDRPGQRTERGKENQNKTWQQRPTIPKSEDALGRARSKNSKAAQFNRGKKNEARQRLEFEN